MKCPKITVRASESKFLLDSGIMGPYAADPTFWFISSEDYTVFVRKWKEQFGWKDPIGNVQELNIIHFWRNGIMDILDHYVFMECVNGCCWKFDCLAAAYGRILEHCISGQIFPENWDIAAAQLRWVMDVIPSGINLCGPYPVCIFWFFRYFGFCVLWVSLYVHTYYNRGSSDAKEILKIGQKYHNDEINHIY